MQARFDFDRHAAWVPLQEAVLIANPSKKVSAETELMTDKSLRPMLSAAN